MPSSDFIDNTLTANADPSILLEPYNTQDANTENIYVRKTYYVPLAYVPLFLAGLIFLRQVWVTLKCKLILTNITKVVHHY